METLLIVGGIIFFIFILIIGGILIWYFFFNNSGTNNNNGNNNNGNNNPNPPAPGGIPGEFSIQPSTNNNLYLTFTNNPNSQSAPTAILTNGDITRKCSDFIWQNTTFNTTFQGSTNSALQINTPTIVIQGNAQPGPFFLTAADDSAAVVTDNGNASDSTWVYNKGNQTFCGSGNNANNCLYYQDNTNVIRKVLNPSDNKFKWTISPVISPPLCTPN